ncbi:thioredoxin domain-containing protein [Sedimentitalea nanhaiensis]|uniref:Regulatory protein SoxS n=1 Tax=Sedimentitalea nanhaiensis TaxID=999627 RepID=A0A1I6ZD31_9RHOB|nr:hypothetical protein [Sedimentitalea nanhaiensis]SFT60603.1 hypothetical protein SAMN05216236_10441 [Sedimentitalea nanhaiensis]
MLNLRSPLLAAARWLVPAVVAGLAALPAWAVELVMVEQVGCEWCARWNDEIAPAYPNTREGQFAPLRRVDLRALPEDLEIARRVNFTPTFLIVDDNREIARLEGYPGEDFFWPLLAALLEQNTDFRGEKR